MSDTQTCTQCGAEIPASAPAGLCPACLLQAALASNPELAVSLSRTQISPPNTGFVPPEPAELAQLFPQLEILEMIGKGGMGAVYKARHPGLDRLVAVKILPSEISHDPAFAERFQREARALARLSHPNIIAIYDFGQTKGLFYFVMEYVDGANLRQTIRGGTIKPQEALAIIPQICDALQFAHDEGIIHRDIKPENILIDKKGRVKIADFGLAKLLGEASIEHPLTGTHQVMGTIRYMAPEQMQGSREIDHRADIYSLGVVFYELLTGELPMGRFAPPSKRVQVDVRLDEVVLRALEQDPQQRYQHASDVKIDMESIVRTTNTAGNTLTGSSATVAQPPVKSADTIQKQVKGPGILLLLSGLALLLPAMWCLSNGLDVLDGNDGVPAEAGGVLIVFTFFLVVLASLIMRGGWHMLSLQSYRAAVWGSFLAPPIGIWGLMVLARPDVRAAFSSGSRISSRIDARPQMVPVLASINVLCGILLMLLSAMDDPSLTAPSVPRFWRIWGQVDAVLGFIMAAGMFAASVGLFLWQSWARKLTIGVCVFGLATVVLDSPYLARSVIPDFYSEIHQSVAADGVDPDTQDILTLLITGGLLGGTLLLGLTLLIGQLVYFTRPRVIAAFDAPSTMPPVAPEADAPSTRTESAARNRIAVGRSIAAWIGGCVVLIVVAASIIQASRHSISGTKPQNPAPRAPVPTVAVTPQPVWTRGPNGPALSKQYATRALEFRPDQLTAVNAALLDAHREYVALEAQHTKHHTDEAGHHVITINPFPLPLSKLEDHLWTRIDAVLDTEQQSLARLNIPLHPKPIRPPMAVSEIVAPGLFGWGQEGARIELWKVGTWFHWKISTRGYEHMDSRATELPPELRHLWNEPTPSAAVQVETNDQPRPGEG